MTDSASTNTVKLETEEKQQCDSISTSTINSAKETNSSESVNLKRSREDAGDKVSNNVDESEPEEKRPSFRLNPPTLIHGQAKSNPSLEASSSTATPKRNFLRPSKLAAPSMTYPLITASSNGQCIPSIVDSPQLGLGMLAAAAGSVSSSNPFLLPSDKDDVEEKDASVFGQHNAQGTANNNNNDKGANGTTTTVNGTKENPFLCPGENSEKSEGFVFGSNMGDRVVKSEADSTSDKPSVEDSPAATEFVFGKNFSGRAKATINETSSNASTGSASSSASNSGTNLSSEVTSSIDHQKKLEEGAAALYAATNERSVAPEVEVITGEEDEKKVLQIPCKLYQFDKTAQSYLERGQGYLRLNDKRTENDDHHFHSRLVMRTHGSLRLVLNTTIWASMMVEKANQKTIRISAQHEGTIGVFLLSTTIYDAEQMYRALEYRVLHLKQLEEKRKQEEETATKSDSNNGAQKSDLQETVKSKTSNSEPTSENQSIEKYNESKPANDTLSSSNANCKDETKKSLKPEESTVKQ